MMRRRYLPITLALLIVAVLAAAYVIVARNNAAMNGAQGEAPAGFMH
jgi:membrane associated rhomboid family serine protease